MMPSPPWALFKKTIQGQGSSKRGTLGASFAYSIDYGPHFCTKSLSF